MASREPRHERVSRALQRLIKAHQFTDPQRKWLVRIGSRLKVETVVDRDALDKGRFKESGGFARLRCSMADSRRSLGELAENVWEDAG